MFLIFSPENVRGKRKAGRGTRQSVPARHPREAGRIPGQALLRKETSGMASLPSRPGPGRAAPVPVTCSYVARLTLII